MHRAFLRSLPVGTLPLLCGCAVLLASPGRAQDAQATVQDVASSEAPVTDPAGLVRSAADAARRMPLAPHVKTRSRLQAELVDTALEIGDLDLARSIVPEIENWRRALAVASIAAHLAEHGTEEAARAELARALELEAGLEDEREQGWRRDRVRATIARTYALLGDPERAAQIQIGLEPSEAGRLAPLAARYADPDKWMQNLEVLAGLAENAEFEQKRHALLAMVAVYGRFATDAESRDTIEAQIRKSWKGTPVEPRIEILEGLVDHDVARGDAQHAQGLAEEMLGFVTGHQWTPEAEVALRARTARKEFAAGLPDAARKTLGAALDVYTRNRGSIVNMYRGRALRPVAEAFVLFGDGKAADDAYRRALIEALENPNGRPRLDDLVQTVRSIVGSGHTPSEDLARLIDAVEGALGAPW